MINPLNTSAVLLKPLHVPSNNVDHVENDDVKLTWAAETHAKGGKATTSYDTQPSTKQCAPIIGHLVNGRCEDATQASTIMHPSQSRSVHIHFTVRANASIVYPNTTPLNKAFINKSRACSCKLYWTIDRTQKCIYSIHSV